MGQSSQVSLDLIWKTDFSTRNGMGVWAREFCLALTAASVRVGLRHEGPPFDPAALGMDAEKTARLRELLRRGDECGHIHMRHGCPGNGSVDFAFPDIFRNLGPINFLTWPGDPRFLAPEARDKVNDTFERIWCDSTYTRDMMVRADIDPAKLDILVGGVNTSVFKPKENQDEEREQFRFLHVAGPQWLQKGFDVLISAFAEEFTPDEPVELILKVKPTETFLAQMRTYQAVEEDRLGRRSNIRIHAATVEYTNMPELYASADCYVQPSRTETFGLPALEAACCGLPLIVTGIGGMTDFANHETALRVRYTEVVMPAGSWKGNHPSTWFEPDRHHLRQCLRWAYDNRGWLAPQARVQAQALRTKWSWESAAQRAIPILHRLLGIS